MKTRPNILAHPLFLGTLFLLLLNDFVFKPYFPGSVTGKLSDVAGVFVFTVFGLALLPRHRRVVALGSALWFVYWKSPLSQPLIDSFNALSLYPIHRVVDYTDLWALPMVPAALTFTNRDSQPVASLPPLKRIGIPLLCLFAFCSTSKASRYGYMAHGLPVDSSKRWSTSYTQDRLDTLFAKAATEVTVHPVSGDQTLSDVYINDVLTLDVWLHVTDKGKKREIRVKGYYVCYYPEAVRVNERILNRVLYEKLNILASGKKPL